MSSGSLEALCPQDPAVAICYSICRLSHTRIPGSSLPSLSQTQTRTIEALLHRMISQQDSQCKYNVILRRVCVFNLPWNSNKYYFVSVCVQFSSMKCAFSVFSSVAPSTINYFCTLFHERHYFRKNVIKDSICVFICYITFT
jgi:hypothetical protein